MGQQALSFWLLAGGFAAAEPCSHSGKLEKTQSKESGILKTLDILELGLRPPAFFGRPLRLFGRPHEVFGRPTESFGRPHGVFGRPGEPFGRPLLPDRAAKSNPRPRLSKAAARELNVTTLSQLLQERRANETDNSRYGVTSHANRHQ